jgi:hypothetical protein
VTTFTPQELFDKAYLGLVAQGKRSYENGCKYRTKDGLKCAVGFLIDDKTAEEWDNFGSIDQVKCHIDREDLPDWLFTNSPMLQRIQQAHDDLADDDAFIIEFKHEMANIATSYGLKVPA